MRGEKKHRSDKQQLLLLQQPPPSVTEINMASPNATTTLAIAGPQ